MNTSSGGDLIWIVAEARGRVPGAGGGGGDRRKVMNATETKLVVHRCAWLMRAPGPGHRRRDEERLTQIAAANAETETLPGPTSGTSNTGTRGDDSFTSSSTAESLVRYT